MIRRSSDKYKLTTAEVSAVVDLVDKEKYLRDIYIKLFEYWSEPILEKSAAIKHENLLQLINLFTSYGYLDPIQGLIVGDFNSGALDTAFATAVVTGTETAYKGLRLLGKLEETNIQTLTPYINNTDKPKVKTLLTQIREDSFVALQKVAARITVITGSPYVAQVLTQAQVDKILGL